MKAVKVSDCSQAAAAVEDYYKMDYKRVVEG